MKQENVNRAFASASDEVARKGFYPDLTNKDSVVGDGDSESRHFSDQDEMSGYNRSILKSCNVINSTDNDYAGHANPERTSVDVSKADRGRES